MYIFYERIKYDYVGFSTSARKHVPRVSFFPHRAVSFSAVLVPPPSFLPSCAATTDSFLSNFKFQFSCAERLNFKRGQDEPTRDENYALIHS